VSVIRTYRARRFDEALQAARRDLGRDAVLLESRELPGVGPRDPEKVEVSAMSRADAVASGVMPDERERDESTTLARRLARVGVPERAAAMLARATVRYHGGAPTTMGSARHALARALSEEMVFHDGARRDGARVIALVGGTGVGKTTTIAKLAAVASLVERRSVALVSIDRYRIGGSEQLERYADLIGCPVEVADDARSLEISLRRLAGADLVLVDTAGRSPRDVAALGAMADTLHGVHEPVDVHLCVPASMRALELRTTIERHSILRPTKLVSTKVDEAFHLGPVVAAQVESGLPLVWFTTGQRVPEDIEAASADRLAALLCGSEGA
jgi:flagellar biosynthesis protein FlhF